MNDPQHRALSGTRNSALAREPMKPAGVARCIARCSKLGLEIIQAPFCRVCWFLEQIKARLDTYIENRGNFDE